MAAIRRGVGDLLQVDGHPNLCRRLYHYMGLHHIWVCTIEVRRIEGKISESWGSEDAPARVGEGLGRPRWKEHSAEDNEGNGEKQAC